MNKWLSAVLMLLIVPVFYYTELHTLMSSVGGAYNRVLVWGTFAFIIVWAAISLEPHYSMPKIFRVLGDASYSLYLTHWLVLPWITLVIDRYALYPKIGLLGLLVICFFVCQFVALLTHFFIEKPLNEKVRRVIFLRGVNRIGVQPATVV